MEELEKFLNESFDYVVNALFKVFEDEKGATEMILFLCSPTSPQVTFLPFIGRTGFSPNDYFSMMGKRAADKVNDISYIMLFSKGKIGSQADVLKMLNAGPEEKAKLLMDVSRNGKSIVSVLAVDRRMRKRMTGRRFERLKDTLIWLEDNEVDELNRVGWIGNDDPGPLIGLKKDSFLDYFIKSYNEALASKKDHGLF